MRMFLGQDSVCLYPHAASKSVKAVARLSGQTQEIDRILLRYLFLLDDLGHTNPLGKDLGFRNIYLKGCVMRYFCSVLDFFK
jgi:hypothetical protein